MQWVNDGLYGNMHSWIADSVSNILLQAELPTLMMFMVAARCNKPAVPSKKTRRPADVDQRRDE